jgi:hypothetical protein
VVLSQTFRTLLQSRMQVGLGKYAQQYPATDQLVFEPNEDDGEMFHTNIFSYSSRSPRVRARLRQHPGRPAQPPRGARRRCSPATALRLRDEVLDDPASASPTAWARAGAAPRLRPASSAPSTRSSAAFRR